MLKFPFRRRCVYVTVRHYPTNLCLAQGRRWRWSWTDEDACAIVSREVRQEHEGLNVRFWVRVEDGNQEDRWTH